MAVIASRVFSSASSRALRRLVGIRNCNYSACSAGGVIPENEEGAAGLKCEEFPKWHNGGGTYHLSALISATAPFEIGAVVHSKAELGDNVCIGSGAVQVIGPAVSVGQSTTIGFGFFVNDTGSMVKKPQLLNVKIGNHVEIGANSCVDRGSWRDTVIGVFTKIDNLVQIGHNVVIGKIFMLCGQVGIAGSATLGDFVTLGGRAAVRDRVSIASKVRLAANTSVTKSIEVSGDYGGFPDVPIHEWRRHVSVERRAQKAGAKLKP